MRLRVVFGILLSASIAFGAQYEKPSPIPSKNKKRQTVMADPDPPKRAPNAQGNEGTACFYKPKAGAANAALRAAHPTLAKGTRVKVTNLGNRKSVVVTVAENGNLGDRIISLSLDAAEQLEFVRAGTAQVRLDVVE